MKTLQVLVTDDEMGMRAGVTRILRDYTVRVPNVEGEIAFSVAAAATGEEAWEIIQKSPPDILLLDYKMPGISGLELLKRVAPLGGEMLTIMITAYASIETAVTATKQGAYDFLSKPFTPEELKNTVRKAAARIVLAKEARKLAEEKRQVRFQFVRVLGHELKAPLNAIDGYLQMLEQRALGDDVSAYDEAVGRCQFRLEGMRKLIADLLDMTHIESGRRERNIEPVDVAALARAALETMAAEAARSRVSLNLSADGQVMLQADRGEIEMILNNLLSNAVKYNREGGRVDIDLQRRDAGVALSVADTGIGMSEEESKRLFGEFVRIKNEKTADIPGSGLGLSIVRKLVDLYDGETNVASRPDEGTKITVILNDNHPQNRPTPNTTVAAPEA